MNPSELYERTTAASGLERQLCGEIAKPYISSTSVVFMRFLAVDITHTNKLPTFDILITTFRAGMQKWLHQCVVGACAL